MDAVKKISLIAVAIGALAMQSSAMAAQATLNFQGTITASACIINGGTNIAMLPANFGTLSTASFTGVGSRAQRNVPINIALTKCPGASATEGINGTYVKIAFTGTAPDVNNKQLLQLTQDPGVATGVGIGLWNAADGKQLNLNPDTPTQFNYDQGVGTADVGTTIKLLADYQQTAATVNPGVANAVGYLSFTYN